MSSPTAREDDRGDPIMPGRVRAGMRPLLLLSAVALLACSGSAGPDGPDISLHALVDRTVAQPPLLRVEIGGRVRTIEAYVAGFRPGLTTEIRGPRYGEVPVHVTLLSSGGAPLAAVGFTQEFERDNNHWVTAQIGTQRPGGFCIGAVEVAPLPVGAFPESGAVQDTLFVMHGRIPKGAIC